MFQPQVFRDLEIFLVLFSVQQERVRARTNTSISTTSLRKCRKYVGCIFNTTLNISEYRRWLCFYIKSLDIKKKPVSFVSSMILKNETRTELMKSIVGTPPPGFTRISVDCISNTSVN